MMIQIRFSMKGCFSNILLRTYIGIYFIVLLTSEYSSVDCIIVFPGRDKISYTYIHFTFVEIYIFWRHLEIYNYNIKITLKNIRISKKERTLW